MRYFCLLFLYYACFVFAGIETQIENDPLIHYAKTNLTNSGVLKQHDSGMLYLDVEDAYMQDLLIFDPDFESTDYLSRPGGIGAHITIVTSKERKTIPEMLVQELGEQFTFEITGLYKISWTRKESVENLVFLKVNSPDLEKLRDKYCFTPERSVDLHITVAQISKQSAPGLILEKNSKFSHTEQKDEEKMPENTLTKSMIQSFRKDFATFPQLQVARNAIAKVGFEEAAIRQDYLTSIDHTYSVHLKNETKITNQMRSGRCWLFAGLNSMRLSLMKKYNLENFEFSQSYMFFWDKLEKSNYFLESIIATRDEDVDGRLVSWILRDPVCDGGQWDMFVNLLDKYGAVPKSCMNETFHSGNSPHLNFMLSHKLREFAMVLREKTAKKATPAQLKKIKEEMLTEIYRILVVHLGEPPQKFNWCFRDKKKKHYAFRNLTPQEFLKKHVPCDYENKVSIIHAPTKDKPYGKTFTVNFLGNIVGGKDLCYLNLPIDDLKKYAIKALKKGDPVWFGCDVGKFFNRKLGVMDLDMYDYPLVFNTELKMNKAQRLDYGDSVLTHAMVLTGVDLDKDQPLKWRVENSWGKDSGNEGYFLMSDTWFDEYLYEIVVDKSLLSEKHQKCLELKPIRLDPWDPFGSLAQ